MSAHFGLLQKRVLSLFSPARDNDYLPLQYQLHANISPFRGSRRPFEADYRILQNPQMRCDPFELNVDDALFPQSQYG
jgi:hypothetical protein